MLLRRQRSKKMSLIIFESRNVGPFNVLKVNASAATFCRLFCSGTFWRPKKVADLLASFWCLFDILLEDKKDSRLFAVLFQKKGQQKVAEPILDAKRSLWKKDVKRSWHLHSALLTS